MNDPCLTFSNISKHFGKVRALDSVNLTVNRGRALALLGPNGAGKSTLFGCLLGFVSPSSGTILLNGREIGSIDRTKIGYLAERVAVYNQRTVVENARYFTGLKGLSIQACDVCLDRVGLGPHRSKKAGDLSKGLLQRLGLAIALCGEPELLVLDEPFNGLDPAVLDVLQQILIEERDRGATLLISTHTMSAVEPVATDVAILLEGSLAAAAELDQLRTDCVGQSLEAIYHRIARSRRVEEVFA